MLEEMLAIRTQDSDTFVRGKLLKIATLLVIPATTISLIYMVATSLASPMMTAVHAAVILAGLVSFALAHVGRVSLGGFVLNATVMGALATVLATGSSLEYASNATYILPILISGLVLRGRAVPLFGLFALGAIAFSYMMSNAPWTAADTSTTLTLGVATGLTWLIVHTLEHAAARAREHADATTIANQTLQQQQASLQMTLDEISASNEQMAALLDLVRDLETPTIPLLDGVLVLPLVGHLDTRRASVLTETALKAVHEQRARIVIVDITGVSVVDTAVAQRVERLAQAIQLLGARVILTGIRADVAQTIVTQGLDFSAIEVVGSLQDGVARVLGERVYTSSQAAPRGNSMSRFASVGA